MRSAILASAASLLALTQARINGFASPQNAKPGSDIKIDITTEGYSQAVGEVAMSFGLTVESKAYLGSLGTFLGNKFLGPDFSGQEGNITTYIHIPDNFPTGPAVLQAAHFALYGATTNPTVEVYYANITIGEGNAYPYRASAGVPKRGDS